MAALNRRCPKNGRRQLTLLSSYYVSEKIPVGFAEGFQYLIGRLFLVLGNSSGRGSS